MRRWITKLLLAAGIVAGSDALAFATAPNANSSNEDRSLNPDKSTVSPAEILIEDSLSQHISTGIVTQRSNGKHLDSKSRISLTIAPNEKIRIPIQLLSTAAAWKLQLQIDNWWQLLSIEVFESSPPQDSTESLTPAQRKQLRFSNISSISEREWRPRLDELASHIFDGPRAANHNERELFFFSNRPEVIVAITNRSQSKPVHINTLTVEPVTDDAVLSLSSSDTKAAMQSPSVQSIPLQQNAPTLPTTVAQRTPITLGNSIRESLVTEYLSNDDSLKLLDATRRLQSDAPDTAIYLQSAIQSWLYYAKLRGVQCISIPIVFRKGSLYPSDHVFKRPIGGATYSPDSLPGDAPVLERYPSIDLVEQIYEACLKTGMHFCPVIDMSFPISELEALRSKVIESPYRQEQDSLLPIVWNPQSKTVTDALQSLLQEVPKRYGHLPNYDGFSVMLEPNTAWWLEYTPEILDPRLTDLAKKMEPTETKEANQTTNQSLGNVRSTGLRDRNYDPSKTFQRWQLENFLNSFANSTNDIVRIYGPKHVHSQTHADRWQYLTVDNSAGSTPRNLLNDWWANDIAPRCYSLASDGNRERYHQNEFVFLPSPKLRHSLTPVSRISREGTTSSGASGSLGGRIKIWSSNSGNETNALILNANPWAAKLVLQWDQDPDKIQILQESTSVTVLGSTNPKDARFELICELPPSSLLPIRWEKTQAKLVGWSNHQDQKADRMQMLLWQFESAVTSLSIPQTEGGLLYNGGFEQAPEPASPHVALGWATSINPNATFRRERRNVDSDDDCLVLTATKNKPQIVWLQPNAFETRTNKLQVSAWISTRSQHRKVTETTPNAEEVQEVEVHQEGEAQTAEDGSVNSLRISVLIWNQNSQRFEKAATKTLRPQRQIEEGWQLWAADLTNDLRNYFREGNTQLVKLHWEISAEGTVALDNLTASSDFLFESERVELRNRIFVAKQALKDANMEPAIRLLEYSWPRLLRSAPKKL